MVYTSSYIFKIYNCYDFKGPLDRTYFPFNALLNHKCFFDLVIKLSRHREDNIPFLCQYINYCITLMCQYQSKYKIN